MIASGAVPRQELPYGELGSRTNPITDPQDLMDTDLRRTRSIRCGASTAAEPLKRRLLVVWAVLACWARAHWACAARPEWAQVSAERLVLLVAWVRPVCAVLPARRVRRAPWVLRTCAWGRTRVRVLVPTLPPRPLRALMVRLVRVPLA